jgi:predicted metal-binding membrane protein
VSDRSLTERLLQRERIVLVAIIGFLFALAGLYTLFGVGMSMSALEMTAMRGMRDMPGPGIVGAWGAGYALLVFLMWWVMMVAMMLPSVSPTVLLYSALLRRGRKADRVPTISAIFLAGYLVTWAGFSVVAAAVQWFLEARGIVSPTMMTLIDTVPGALILIAAGVFQFTPLKQTCLRHCRSPAEFITRRKRSGVTGAFFMGLEHGVYCLGCCWFVMALLFVGGIMNLFWIVGLATFVALEKLTPYGEIISKIAGTALIGWGAYVVYASL